MIVPGRIASWWPIMRRTAVRTWDDGFIHAGNLAYLAMLAIFPFFIVGAAAFQLFGEEGERIAVVNALLAAMPPNVAETIAPVARDTIEARSGWLLWAGAGVGLWTVSSLIETIRDVLQRAYRTPPAQAFWKARLKSIGLIIGAVSLMIFSLLAQFVIGGAEQFIENVVPQFASWMGELRLTRAVPALGLFGSLYLLFLTLTPRRYRVRAYPKWPGALATTLWWLAVTIALPAVISNFFSYSLTYGSLAGIMVTLFFFWLVGLGLVMGAELNAALAWSRDGQSDADMDEEIDG